MTKRSMGRLDAVRAYIEPALASHVTLIFEDPLIRPKLMQTFGEDQKACLHRGVAQPWDRSRLLANCHSS
jgi:hypothetical protein